MKYSYSVLAIFLMLTITAGRPRLKAHERKKPETQNLNLEDLYARIVADETAQKRKIAFMMKRLDAVKARSIGIKQDQKRISDLILDLDDDVAFEMEGLRNRTAGLEYREHRYTDEIRYVYLELKRINEVVSSLGISEGDLKNLCNGTDYVARGPHVNETEPSEFDTLQITLKKLSAQIKWIYTELKANHIV